VKELDQDDWKKLLRVLSYLHSTLRLMLTLQCEDLKKVDWYVDSSYAVHDNMRGQNGTIMITGGCGVLCRSNKQKVNTRSSTESELIAIDDTLPTI
jgi:hypothetical protein